MLGTYHTVHHTATTTWQPQAEQGRDRLDPTGFSYNWVCTWELEKRETGLRSNIVPKLGRAFQVNFNVSFAQD